MTKMRVHELAKSLDKTSKEVIEFLRSQNVAVASHASSVEDEHVEMVKAKFASSTKAETPAKVEAPVKAEDERYTYEFDKWEPAVEEIVTKDAEYTATYKAIEKE